MEEISQINMGKDKDRDRDTASLAVCWEAYCLQQLSQAIRAKEVILVVRTSHIMAVSWKI